MFEKLAERASVLLKEIQNHSNTLKSLAENIEQVKALMHHAIGQHAEVNNWINDLKKEANGETHEQG